MINLYKIFPRERVENWQQFPTEMLRSIKFWTLQKRPHLTILQFA